MHIRHYQPGDEPAQARVYNTAAGALPGFKPASADEIARRFRNVDPDVTSKFYAIENDEIVGYSVFNPDGRISYPWCLPEAQAARRHLLEAVLSAMIERGCPEAWAAYRADWAPVLDFFRQHRFVPVREMINYVAEVARLPHTPVPEGRVIAPLWREELPQVLALGKGLIAGDDPESLEAFFWENPFFGAESLLALKSSGGGKLLGAAVVVGDAGYADPTAIDAAMPCFRLGALGTERQRHKRVNGLFSCVFEDEPAAEALLAEATRRLEQVGLAHMAAQAPSDRPELVAFYDRRFRRQGAFPVLARRLSD